MSRSPRSPETIRTLPLFEKLTDSQYVALTPSLSRESFPPRACLLRAGDAPDALYVVLAGSVRVVHEDTEGHALIAATLGVDDFFGEMGLIDAAPCPASFHTVERCEILRVPREAFVHCLEASPGTAMYVLRIVLERLCAAHRKMATLALMNVYRRVARVLLDNGREADGDWMVEPGSEQIAAMVGASREMVSRVVRRMIRDGSVRREKRKLVVLDRAALARSLAPPPAAEASCAPPRL